jgi:hypothetical protein
MLAAFLLSFLFICTSTRLIRDPRVTWWPGNVETKSGLHIHHMVLGILLLLVSGFLAFALAPASPGYEILAVLFGIGAGLTLDEFAIWVHLEDVYWTDEGRQSVDAEGGRKRERAQARAERLAARQSRVLDLIGGAPTKEG